MSHHSTSTHITSPHQILVSVSVVFMFASRMTVESFYDGSIDCMVDVCDLFFSEYDPMDAKKHRELLEAIFCVGADVHRYIEVRRYEILNFRDVFI